MNVINVSWKRGDFGSGVETLLNQLVSANQNAPFSEIDQSEASIFKYFNWGEANAVGGWEPLSNQSLNKLPPN